MITITTQVNGVPRQLSVRPNQLLLEVLRDDLNLRGAVEGCGVGVCGSCTVLLDRKPISSCLMLAANVDGREITTIEGLGSGETLDPVQQAFLDHQAFQCGYCTPGMIMAVKGLLYRNPRATVDEIADYLSGNVCRCGTYLEVMRAARAVIAAQVETTG
ncbi:MAG TPA: (2Fe-2S)-binding protein [Candidatus Dormibacteraeota bacterium]|jgi:aerobic-type carbon monoxide dehydrogenase small subunit (CoxS/CutS family)